MVDPLTGLGAGASALQLADIVGRLIKELYAFSSAVCDAPKSMQRLCVVLKDLETSVVLLKRRIAESEANTSTARLQQPRTHIVPADSFASPEISLVLKSLETELNGLKTMIPPHAKTNLRQKLKWVFDEGKIKEKLDRLHEHKDNLQLTINIVALHQNTEQHQDLRRVHSNVHRLIQSSEQQKDLSRKLEQRVADFASPQSSTTVVEADPEVFGRIVRSEIQAMLLPALNQTLGEYDSRYEAHFRKLHVGIGDVASNVTQALAASKNAAKEQGANVNCSQSLKIDDAYGNRKADRLHRPIEDTCLHEERSIPLRELQARNSRDSLRVKLHLLDQKTWVIYYWGGLAYIDVKTQHPRTTSSKRRYELTVSFLPSVSLAFYPGVSMSFTSAPDARGYLQLCPAISIFRRIDMKSTYFNLLLRYDLEGIQKLFLQGLIGPYDRFDNGRTPLHFAASRGHDKMCEVLLREGLDPFAEDWSGLTPLGYLHESAFDAIIRRARRGKRRHYVLESFQRTCTLLEEAGASSTETFERALNSLRVTDGWDGAITPVEREALCSWIEFLRPRHFDPNQKLGGFTPLMLELMQMGSPQTPARVGILLQCGSNLSMKSESGDQALHVALRQYDMPRRSDFYRKPGIRFSEDGSPNPEWREALTKTLVHVIKAGADVNGVNTDGCSPMQVAYESGVVDEYSEARRRCGLDTVRVNKKATRKPGTYPKAKEYILRPLSNPLGYAQGFFVGDEVRVKVKGRKAAWPGTVLQVKKAEASQSWEYLVKHASRGDDHLNGIWLACAAASLLVHGGWAGRNDLVFYWLLNSQTALSSICSSYRTNVLVLQGCHLLLNSGIQGILEGCRATFLNYQRLMDMSNTTFVVDLEGGEFDIASSASGTTNRTVTPTVTTNRPSTSGTTATFSPDGYAQNNQNGWTKSLHRSLAHALSKVKGTRNKADHKETIVRTLEECPNGYPRLAAFLDSDNNFMLYRRFGFIHTRLLLHKQDELREIEERLDAMDYEDDEAGPRRQRCLRSREQDEARHRDSISGRQSREQLLRRAEELVREYGQLLLQAQQLVAMNRPNDRAYCSVRNYMDNTKPLLQTEERFIHQREDLVTLRPGREEPWLNVAIERALFGTKIRFFTHSFFRSGKASNENIQYSDRRIGCLINSIIASFIMLLLAIPMYILYRVSFISNKDLATQMYILVLLIATSLLSIILRLFTRAKRHEVLASAAAYCAILIIFTGNFSPRGT